MWINFPSKSRQAPKLRPVAKPIKTKHKFPKDTRKLLPTLIPQKRKMKEPRGANSMGNIQHPGATARPPELPVWWKRMRRKVLISAP
jgi:hypothetical protein